MENVFQGRRNIWKVSVSAWQVMGCHSRASETAAEQIQPDKLKSGYGQKSDWVAFFFFFSEKLGFPGVFSVKSASITSRRSLLLSLPYRCNVVQGQRARVMYL